MYIIYFLTHMRICWFCYHIEHLQRQMISRGSAAKRVIPNTRNERNRGNIWLQQHKQRTLTFNSYLVHTSSINCIEEQTNPTLTDALYRPVYILLNYIKFNCLSATKLFISRTRITTVLKYVFMNFL